GWCLTPPGGFFFRSKKTKNRYRSRGKGNKNEGKPGHIHFLRSAFVWRGPGFPVLRADAEGRRGGAGPGKRLRYRGVGKKPGRYRGKRRDCTGHRGHRKLRNREFCSGSVR